MPRDHKSSYQNNTFNAASIHRSFNSLFACRLALCLPDLAA
jgi:hypothetical protein